MKIANIFHWITGKLARPTNASLTKIHKNKSGKPRYTLLVPWFISEMVAVMEYGNTKYDKNSWRYVSDDDLLNAIYRHLFSLSRGEYYDSIESGGSGRSHLVHIAVNAMMLWAKTHKSGKIDSNIMEFIDLFENEEK